MDQRRMEDNMDRTKEIFMFREPMVLLPILCLSLLSGIASHVDGTRFFDHVETGKLTESIVYYNYMQILAPFPGVILITFISEIKGRKIAFIQLFALCVLSAILNFIPYRKPWAVVENFIVAGVRAGVSPITTIAICEYCRPKHRFAYLVASLVLNKVGSGMSSVIYSAEVISKESPYLAIFELIIALVCLVSVYWWPESPYWLRSQSRYQESRDALLCLRRDGDEALKELNDFETSRRRQSPKLFWLTLFVAFLTITVARCAYSGQNFLTILNTNSSDFISSTTYSFIFVCVSSVVSLLIVLVSYKVQRKVVYLSTTIISIALVYAMSIWAYRVAEHENKSAAFHVILFISNSILGCGPCNLSLALLMEFIPRKYNTFISCLSYLYFLFSMYIFTWLPLNHQFNFPAYGFMLIFATLMLVAILILYCLVPETRDKNLLEIEKLCLSRVYGDDFEQNQIVLEDLPK